jgi:hypothetical protein
MVDDDDESVDSIGPNEALPDFKKIARDIQNRASGRVLSKETEARLFREFFGTSARIVNILWEFLVRDRFLPRGGRPWHLLWALYFMKVYPKQGPGCAVVGASHGAVNPKTHRKWVWAFIEAISELVDLVVSFLILLLLLPRRQWQRLLR